MRRFLSLALLTFEATVGVLLLAGALLLPSGDLLRQAADRAGRLTADASREVRAVRDDVRSVRDPRVRQLTQDMLPYVVELKRRLSSEEINHQALLQVNQGLGDLAQAMQSVADLLDADRVRVLTASLGKSADYLDQKLAPTAESLAKRLQTSGAELQKDAQILAQVLRDGTPDLKSAREVYDSLGQFDQGLEKLGGILKKEKVDSLRDGFKGMETALDTSAGQVERLTGFTYPVITVENFKPRVEQKPFWPDGQKIAEGLRKGAQGMKTAGTEMDVLVKELPAFQKSLDEGRKSIARTREALGKALKNQDKLEPLLKTVPQRTVALAEQLPKFLEDLTRVLRDLSEFKAVARDLRQTQESVDALVKNWPQVRESLQDKAGKLRNLQKELNERAPDELTYREKVQKTLALTETLEKWLPTLTDHLDARLEHQQQSLDRLGGDLEHFSTTLPGLGQTAANLLLLARALLLSLGLCLLLHAALHFLQQRTSPPVGTEKVA